MFGYADTLSVLRKGKYVGGGKVTGFTKADIAELMVGNKVSEIPQRRNYADNVLKLQLFDLYDKEGSDIAVLNNLSLKVKKGEIYGIAGVSGNGQKRLVEILAGQKTATSGKIMVDATGICADEKGDARNKVLLLAGRAD